MSFTSLTREGLTRRTKADLVSMILNHHKVIENLATELRDTKKAAEHSYAILSNKVKDAEAKLQVAVVIIDSLTKENDLMGDLFNDTLALHRQQYRPSRDLRNYKVHRAIEGFVGFPIAICYNCGHLQKADPSLKEGGQNLCAKCLEVSNG